MNGDKDEFLEPEELKYREPTLKDKIFKVFKAFMALIILVGFLYISGIYQYLLFHKTSSDLEQEKLAGLANAEIITLPLSIFIVSGKSNWATQKDKEEIENLVNNTSNIWSQANIEFKIKEISNIELPEESREMFFNDPASFIKNVSTYDPNSINVFLTKLLGGLNGIAFLGTQSLIVAEYTSTYDFKVLAHEIGHILDLDHTKDKTRLMSQGSTGNKLTAEEISSARQKAQEIIK